jgi:hypothetical protein
MLTQIKQTLSRHLLNIPGWRTRRKIVVIESDDWGMIRMSSKEAFQALLKKGYPVDQCAYNRLDALESNEDLSCLFEVLTSVRDSCGNPAILTANNIVANPDFDKIREADYRQYFYEPFTETLKKYPAHDRVMQLYRQGKEEKLIQMQFHGREHVQVSRWMSALQRREKGALDAFEWGIFSPKNTGETGDGMEYLDAFDTDGQPSTLWHTQIVAEGMALFEQLWGHSSSSFIAPCYTWSSDLEPYLAAMGVKYLQGITYQREPVAGKPFTYRNVYHYQGQQNAHGQRYLVRNAFFEPSIMPHTDWVNDCLQRISIAFSWGKPAIIGSHRINYIGYLQPNNREKNLRLLNNLLRQIITRWPDVEFMSTDQLGFCITQ